MKISNRKRQRKSHGVFQPERLGEPDPCTLTVETRPSPQKSVHPPRLTSGEVGPYHLIAELGSGGMATVYLARDRRRPGVHGVVALKRLHEHLSKDPSFKEMFLDEARVASRIRHPNVAMVLDYEASSHGYYIVQEYLSGRPLSCVCQACRVQKDGARRRAGRIARIVADISEGVHAAHEMKDEEGNPIGLVHRDIAPDNLFLTFHGVAKVIDFGVARSSLQTHETQTGVVKGKLAYLPPEALRGKELDRRADVWGLGIVVWEMLTQQRLFRRESDAETLQAVVNGPIIPPSGACSEVPSEFDEVVLRALDRDPEKRFSTAREFGRTLLDVSEQIGYHVHQSDLSDWMDELFPGGRARSDQLIEMGSEVDLDAPTRVFSPRESHLPLVAPREGSSQAALVPVEIPSPPLAPTPTLIPATVGACTAGAHCLPSARTQRSRLESWHTVLGSRGKKERFGSTTFFTAVATAALAGAWASSLWTGRAIPPVAPDATPMAVGSACEAAAVDPTPQSGSAPDSPPPRTASARQTVSVELETDDEEIEGKQNGIRLKLRPGGEVAAETEQTEIVVIPTAAKESPDGKQDKMKAAASVPNRGGGTQPSAQIGTRPTDPFQGLL